MQDRFKFRIWDKPTSRMFYDVALGFIKAPMRSDWVCADTPDGQISYTGDRLKDIEIMQCTGLKDKNGKLVYFNDLVKNKWGQICKVIMQTDERNYGCIVLQNIKYLNDEAYCNDIFVSAVINKSAVIGNIYENPELLEED